MKLRPTRLSGRIEVVSRVAQDPTTSARALNAKAVEARLTEAADLIASTLEQPTDPRAWSHLLIYCPRELLEKRLRALEHKDRVADRERRIRNGGRLWLEV